MRSFDAIDAELSTLTVGGAALARALEGVRDVRGASLSAIDTMLATLDVASASRPMSAPLDEASLFGDVGSSRHSIPAPIPDEPMSVQADVAPSAAGDLAGLLEGSNSLMPPAPEESLPSVSIAVPISVAMPIDEDYEEMRAEHLGDDDEPLSTEIELIDE